MALALLLRAPGLPTSSLAIPGEGWVPICSGGEIVLIYVGDGPPPVGDHPAKAHGQPCTAFGLSHFAPSDPGGPSLPHVARATPRPAPDVSASASNPAIAFRSRAPPFPSV